MALLLDRRGLGVALDHNQAAQGGAMFARDFLPRRLAVILAEGNDAVLFLGRQKDAPAIFRHLDVVELGPAARIDRIGGAQIHQRLLKAFRPHVAPPIHVTGMPALERLQHLAVLAEIHVVGDFGAVVDIHEIHGVLLGFANGEWRIANGEENYSLFATPYSPLKLSSYRIAPSGRCRSGAARPLRRPRWDAGRSS